MAVLGGYSIIVNWKAGPALGAFSKVAGIRSENNVLDSTNAFPGKAPLVQKMPGKYNCSPAGVTLSAGYMQEMIGKGSPWWDSVVKIQNGDVESVRGDVDIIIFNNEKQPVLTVTLEQAWPSKWSASDLSVQQSIAWVETIVFQCEHIKFSWSVG